MGDLDHFARPLGQAAALELRGEAGLGRLGAQEVVVGDGPVLHQVPGRVERGRVVEQADPQGRQRRQHRQRTGIGAAHLEVVLQPHLGEGRGDVVGPVVDRRQLARPRRQLALEEILEVLARGIDVLAVAIDEVHRHVQHVVDIALEAEAVLEHEGQHAAAVGIGVGPDVAAIALEAHGLAFDERRVGEQGGGQRLQRERHAELLHHVGFGLEVEVGLHGTGAQHHVDAELALLGHVLAHDLVAPLGHPVDVLARPLRREAQADEARADLARDLLDLVEVLLVLVRRLVQGLERRARQLELAARLERDAGLAAQQRDRVVALDHRLPAEARQAFEHGADAVRPVVGKGFIVCLSKPNFSCSVPMRHAVGLVAGSEVLDQLPPIFDRRAAARRWCGHATRLPRHSQPSGRERRGHMSYSHASLRLVHDVQLPRVPYRQGRTQAVEAQTGPLDVR